MKKRASEALQLSANVVMCPHCKGEVGSENGFFEEDAEKGESWFKVTHAPCGKTFSVHHRKFYRRGGSLPRARNPFDPIKIF